MLLERRVFDELELRMKSISFLFVALMITTIATATEPAAVSRAFISNDPIVLQALDLLKSGKFKEAESLLAASTNQINSEALRDRTETIEIIRRIRFEYS